MECYYSDYTLGAQLQYNKILTGKFNHGKICASPNTGKYWPEKTPYLDTFHGVYNKKTVRKD